MAAIVKQVHQLLSNKGYIDLEFSADLTSQITYFCETAINNMIRFHKNNKKDICNVHIITYSMESFEMSISRAALNHVNDVRFTKEDRDKHDAYVRGFQQYFFKYMSKFTSCGSYFFAAFCMYIMAECIHQTCLMMEIPFYDEENIYTLYLEDVQNFLKSDKSFRHFFTYDERERTLGVICDYCEEAILVNYTQAQLYNIAKNMLHLEVSSNCKKAKLASLIWQKCQEMVF